MGSLAGMGLCVALMAAPLFFRVAFWTAGLLVLSAWRSGLDTIAGWLGVQTYPPAVLFAVALLFILAVLLHYSTAVSRLTDQNVVLAQRLGLLELELRLVRAGEAAAPEDGEEVAAAAGRAAQSR